MKGSRSSNSSPVPMKTMGAPVAATADRAPPPYALTFHRKKKKYLGVTIQLGNDYTTNIDGLLEGMGLIISHLTDG